MICDLVLVTENSPRDGRGLVKINFVFPDREGHELKKEKEKRLIYSLVLLEQAF